MIPSQWVSNLFLSRIRLTSALLGGFATFGPGKFENMYTGLNNPAAKGRLHFAGEGMSVRHASVEGALDSAWRAVCEMLILGGFTAHLEKFYQHWGMNSEWLTSTNTYNGYGRPSDEDNLLLEHLRLSVVTHDPDSSYQPGIGIFKQTSGGHWYRPCTC